MRRPSVSVSTKGGTTVTTVAPTAIAASTPTTKFGSVNFFRMRSIMRAKTWSVRKSRGQISKAIIFFITNIPIPIQHAQPNMMKRPVLVVNSSDI